MERNEQANLLSIFSFIFAGIQALALLFIGLYALMMLGVLVMGLVNGTSGDAGAYIVPAFIAVLFGIMAGVGLTNVILNIKLGRALRSSRPPTPKRVIVTSIFNLCSFLCGGVFILPFGMALGIFGIVFASSEKGKAYLGGLPSRQIGTPPPPMTYTEANQGGHIWR
jgi:hypothetical protein